MGILTLRRPFCVAVPPAIYNYTLTGIWNHGVFSVYTFLWAAAPSMRQVRDGALALWRLPQRCCILTVYHNTRGWGGAGRWEQVRHTANGIYICSFHFPARFFSLHFVRR